MKHFRIIALCSFLIRRSNANVAVPYPGEIYEKQPDGSVATLRLSGHPYTGVFQTDLHGHPVNRDEEGWFVYASYQNLSLVHNGKRQLEPSSRRVGSDDPPSHPPPSLENLTSRRNVEMHRSSSLSDVPPVDSSIGNATENSERFHDMFCRGMDRSPWCPHNPVDLTKLGRSATVQGDQFGGKLNMIVILVKFSDHVDKPVADVSRFNTLFNVDGFDDDTIPTGSVKRFFQIQSAGKLEVTAYVEDWIVAPNTEEYYSFGNNGLDPKFTAVANGALDRMDARGTDWSLFDRDNVSNNCS
jgi:hypothetical protein